MFKIICPACGNVHQAKTDCVGVRLSCQKCATVFMVTPQGRLHIPIAAPVEPPRRPPGIACKVCDIGTLETQRIPRFGGVAEVIGVLLVIPPGFVAAWTGYQIFSIVSTVKDVHNAGDAINAAVGYRVIMLAVAVAFCAPGVFLSSRKPVLKCDNCGATVATD